jgi:hypothetical protein
MVGAEDGNPRRHLLAAWLVLGLLAGWAAAMAAAVHAIGTRPDRSGALLAVFPPFLDEFQILARVSRAEGSLVAGTWLPNVWHVHGEARNFAAALRGQGASLVLPPLPVALPGIGGCFGMPTAGPG